MRAESETKQLKKHADIAGFDWRSCGYLCLESLSANFNRHDKEHPVSKAPYRKTTGSYIIEITTLLYN
jgi:hypothetical protein